MPNDLSLFLGQVLAQCASITSVWLLGTRDGSDLRRCAEAFDWDLLAFADLRALQRLRRSTHLHREDVHFRVVTDGTHIKIAWGTLQDSGSLLGWSWRRADGMDAYYDEAAWAEPMENGIVRRIRRRALRLWEKPAAMSDIGHTS